MKQTHSVRLATCAQLEPQEVLKYIRTPRTGLTEELSQTRRREYGDNSTVDQSRDTIRHRLRRAFINPFSVVLLLLAAISFITDVVLASNFSRDVTMVTIILLMLLLSGIVRFTQEVKSKQIADRLVQLVHTTVQVRRVGIWMEIPSEELVVGDLIRLEAGDRVPADIRILLAEDFFVTQSVITGESGILEKTADALPGPPLRLHDYTNSVFMGSTVTGGSCEGVVLAVGQESAYGAVSPPSRKHGYDRGENSIAWVLIRYMALLVPIVFVACGITKGNWVEAFLFALSVAVGLTPELLPMVITACLARGSAQMGGKQTVVKNVNAMEGFGSMDILCVDKTGTLTGDMVQLEYYMDILGNESPQVLELGYLNSVHHTGVSNHLDAAMLRVREIPGQEGHYARLTENYRKLDELPFDYQRRFASVLLTHGEKSLLVVKGSLNQVVARCSHVYYRGQQLEMGTDVAQSVHSVVDEMLRDGMKVLAVAAKTMEGTTLSPGDETDLTLMGYLAFFDAPKESAKSAIERLHQLHIDIKVLTGDHEDVAVSVCRRLGIRADRVLTGAQLETLSDNEIPIAMEQCCIFAELTPRQKAHIVSLLQEGGHSVGFLGDGMNDLPAVVQADVGISVDNATEAVKDSADVILLKKDLNVLGEGVLEGRRAFANMNKYIRITASSNFGNICAIVLASVLLPFFPMTSIQLLLLNLLYDCLCLILPWDNVDPEHWERPLEWSGRTLGRFMAFFGPISSAFDLLTFGFLYLYLCPKLCGGSYMSLDSAGQALFISLFQTGWFLESMWTQVLILHLLRTGQLPFIQSRPSGWVLAVTILGIILFSTLTMTPLGAMLGLTAMPLMYLGYLISAVLLYMMAVTWMKRSYIRRYRDLI